MATRPWATPDEVRDYSDIARVMNRADMKLAVDISRAEQAVIDRTNNRFDDAEKYPLIPLPVKHAVILIAEYYAERAQSGVKNMKSESFDDYSYTLSDSGIGFSWSDIDPLLDEYVIQKSRNGVVMKLRKL